MYGCIHNIHFHFAVSGLTDTHTHAHSQRLSGRSLGSYERTSCLVCHRAPFILSELLRYRHMLMRIKFQLANVDARSYCVSKCVGVWSSCRWYLICVFLPRVDKDRSGVISDSELQQALSNGMCHGLTVLSLPFLFLSYVHISLPSFSLSFSFPLCLTFLLLPLFWSLRLPPISLLHTIALHHSLI